MPIPLSIELAFDSLLKGREGITHRQKVMNKYLNIVDRPPVDGCDIITTIDVDMQDICEKALVDKLKELEAVSGVAILMDVPTGDVKAIVNMTRGQDGNYYEMRPSATCRSRAPPSRPLPSWWRLRMVKLRPTTSLILATASR